MSKIGKVIGVLSFFVLALVVLGEHGNTTEKVDDSLVLCLHFDENEDKNGYMIAKDSSGKDNNGDIMDGEWTKGKVGSGLKFNGETTYVMCPKKDLGITDKVTMEAWFKRDKGYTTTTIIMANTWMNRIILLLDSSDLENRRIEGSFEVGEAQCGVASKPQPYAIGKWIYAVATYDGSKARLYINGKLIGEKESKGKLRFCGPIYIGCEDGEYWLFRGVIDEVKVYNRVLSQEEIKKNYSSE